MELKDVYLDRAEQMTVWQLEIDSLEKRAQGAEAQARIEYLSKMDELKAKHNAAQVNLKDLQEAGAENRKFLSQKAHWPSPISHKEQ